MRHIHTAAKYGRLTEHHVLHSGPISVKCIFYSAEPHQVGHAGSIAEMGHKTLFAPLTNLLKTEYLTLKLDIGHGAVNLLYLEDAAAVNIFVRKIVEQILQRAYLELAF